MTKRAENIDETSLSCFYASLTVVDHEHSDRICIHETLKGELFALGRENSCSYSCCRHSGDLLFALIVKTIQIEFASIYYEKSKLTKTILLIFSIIMTIILEQQKRG